MTKVIIVPNGRILSVEIHSPGIRSIVATINKNHINGVHEISGERAAELIKDAIERELNWTVGNDSKKF